MADSAHKKIMDKIGARLALITVANGYYFTVLKVEQTRPQAFLPYDLPAIHYMQVASDTARDAYGYESHTLTVLLITYTLSNETTAIGAIASEIGAAITTALNRKTTAPLVSDAINLDLDGYVQSLVTANFRYELGEGEAPFLTIYHTLTITYRAPMGDAFTVEA